MEFEDVFTAKKGDPTGNAIRLYANAFASIYPFAEALDRRLEGSVEYSFWQDLHESKNLNPGDDQRGLFAGGLTYYLIQYSVRDEKKTAKTEQALGIGVEYVNGSNPREGKPHEEYGQITLKMKL